MVAIVWEETGSDRDRNRLTEWNWGAFWRARQAIFLKNVSQLVNSGGNPAIESTLPGTGTNIGNLKIFSSSRYAWVQQILILFFPIMMCLVQSDDSVVLASCCWAHTFLRLGTGLMDA